MTLVWSVITQPRLRLIGLRSERVGPFDLVLAPRDCLAVTGPLGAGKSLMLRMIADLDPHEGDALLDIRPCATTPGAAGGSTGLATICATLQSKWRRGLARA